MQALVTVILFCVRARERIFSTTPAVDPVEVDLLPVLSEHMTFVAPRVSVVIRLLHRICFLAKAEATTARLMVTPGDHAY